MNRTNPSIEIKRHCRELSTKETDEVIEAMADLIVAFVVGNCKPSANIRDGQVGKHPEEKLSDVEQNA